MAAMITIEGIDEALSNLPYRNRTTLKPRLLNLVRSLYDHNDSTASVVGIDRDELIRSLWDLGNDPTAIRNKRRNFSSLKSSINKDLKNLFESGRNPEGIILGPDNIFTLCDDAKDRILDQLSDTIKGSERANLDKITKVLEAVDEILSDPNALPDSQGAEGAEKLNQLKRVLKSLSSNVGPAYPPSGEQGGSELAGEYRGESQLDLEGKSGLFEEVKGLAGPKEAEKQEEGEEPEEVEDLDEVEVVEEEVEELEEVLEEPDEAEELEEIEDLDETGVAEAVEEAEESKEDFPAGQLDGEAETGAMAGEMGNQGKGVEPLGLPVDSLGQSFMEGGFESENHIDKARLLAEEFDGFLGTMDRFYNHYLLVPSGKYVIGSKAPRANELSDTTVDLDAFYIGRFPVTNALFEIFVEKTGYRTTAEEQGYATVYEGRYKITKDASTGKRCLSWQSAITIRKVKGACWFRPTGPGSTLHNKRNHPVVQVSLQDAIAFAAWTGKRLPSEEEWEAAARTLKGYIYPWGDEWQEGQCNVEESREGDTTPVDKFVSHANELGIADTLGNVLEWTLSQDHAHSEEQNEIQLRLAKGGSWTSSGKDISLCLRHPLEPDSRSNILGFRCVAY